MCDLEPVASPYCGNRVAFPIAKTQRCPSAPYGSPRHHQPIEPDLQLSTISELKASASHLELHLSILEALMLGLAACLRAIGHRSRTGEASFVILYDASEESHLSVAAEP
jgi:hypothetical protein